MVTSLADSGAGSLRDAVACASAGSTITFAPATFSVPRTITLATQIPITRSLVISGPGSGLLTISGAGVTRMLFVDAGAANDVRLFGLTLSRGRVIADNGGAIYVQTARSLTISDTRIVDNATFTAKGGGLYILNNVPLTLVDSQVVSNTAGSDYGGFFASGAVTITNSQIASNVTRADFGGFYVGGPLSLVDSQVTSNSARLSVGGFWANGALTIDRSRISANSAGRRAGGVIANAALTMTNSEIISNIAGTDYGGVYVVGGASIANSLIAGNFAVNRAGGVWLSGPAVVAGSTIASNTAGVGAGIFAEAAVLVSNTTIAANSAFTQAGGVFLQSASAATFVHASVVSNLAPAGAGVAFNGPGPHTFTNTLVGGAAADQCAGTSTKRNFSSLTTDADCGLRTVASIGVGSLGDYGGGRPTAPLVAASPALDAASPAACPATDQRGLSRVGACDVGAYESRGFTMALQSGAVQTTTTNSAFPAPLVVRFFSNSGEPLGPGGLLSVTSAGISPAAASVRVDAQGWATVPLTAGVSSGVYPITVTAPGVAAPVTGRLTNLAPGQPTPTPTRTPTATATPAPTSTPATPTPTPTPSTFAPYVSPNYGPVTTSTVSIISLAGGLTGATDVFVNGVKTSYTVINDTRINFLMRPGVPGSTVDVALVRAGGGVVTFTRAYTFEAATSAAGSVSTGVVLTTTSGVTINVPPQTALRPASVEVGGSLVITYTPADQPAEPPGNVPLSFFEVGVVIEDSAVTVLPRPATLELSVDLARVPVSERPWLYQWTPTDGGQWVLVPGQAYDPTSGRVSMLLTEVGRYALSTSMLRTYWLPVVPVLQ